MENEQIITLPMCTMRVLAVHGLLEERTLTDGPTIQKLIVERYDKKYEMSEINGACVVLTHHGFLQVIEADGVKLFLVMQKGREHIQNVAQLAEKTPNL